MPQLNPAAHDVEETSGRRTWRSWFTNERIAFLSIVMVLVVFGFSQGNKASQTEQRKQAYQEEVASSQAFATVSGSSNISLQAPPEGFSDGFDPQYFDKFTIKNIALAPGKQGNGPWEIRAIPNQRALDNPDSFKQQIDYISSFSGITKVEFYKLDGAILTTDSARLSKLSVQDLTSIIRMVEESVDTEEKINLSEMGISISTESENTEQIEAEFQRINKIFNQSSLEYISYSDKYNDVQMGKILTKISLNVGDVRVRGVDAVRAIQLILEYDWEKSLESIDVRAPEQSAVSSASSAIMIDINLDDSGIDNETAQSEKIDTLIQSFNNSGIENIDMVIHAPVDDPSTPGKTVELYRYKK